MMEIGMILKEARESNDISLDSLQETTKIQKRYLLAIEQGNLHLLPGKFYARAFIKEYATAVGLDPDELLMGYQEGPTSAEEMEQEMQYSRVQRTRRENKSSKSPAILSIIPKIIVILLVIGIVVAAIFFYQKAMSNEKPEQVEQPDSDEIIRNKGNQQDPPENDTSANEDQKEPEDEKDEEDQDDQESEKVEPKLELTDTGTGSRPESTFELSNTDEEIVITFEPTGVSWLDVKNDQNATLLGLNTEADTPVELEITEETRVRINIGNITQLPVILINDIELEYPTDSMTQSFWININNTSE